MVFPSWLVMLVGVLTLLVTIAPCNQGSTQTSFWNIRFPAIGTVLLGIDVLLNEKMHLVEGKRIGLITNQTGVTHDRKSTIDVLHEHPHANLVTLYGPEHGIRGSFPAGERVPSYTDPKTQLHVFSLYGDQRKPTDAMLANVDILLYDIQDIGVRSYTYISTMSYGMEAAARKGIPFVVLDRPLPYSGEILSGNILDRSYDSIVGRFPIPYVYGMTCGELARMINEEGWLENGVRCELIIVPMKHYSRSMSWQDTGLIWIPTSPHIPHWHTSLYYAATGVLGELDSVNIGVGFTLPFEVFGLPDLDGAELANRLNRKGLTGVYFHPFSYPVFYGKYRNQQCSGVRIYITEPERAEIMAIQFYIYEVLREMEGDWDILRNASHSRYPMFDKVLGSSTLRRDLMEGVSVRELVSQWHRQHQQFRRQRQPYLIYQ